jgi:putative ABC transport system ATP-binding protein
MRDGAVASGPSRTARPAGTDPADDSVTPVIDLTGVVFCWPGAHVPLFDRLALRVARGERVFLRGPSGTGKSTLLSLLTGVLTPQAGDVRVLGANLAALRGAGRDRFRADHIGYIFQMFNLIPYLTVIENVCLPCGFSKARTARARRGGASVAAEARRLLDHLDLGESGMLSAPVTQLSVGQQQRVAAARALIGAPELIIADEPTSALDADRRVAFLDLLFRECAREGTTLVFASHDVALAAAFDRTIDLAPAA